MKGRTYEKKICLPVHPHKKKHEKMELKLDEKLNLIQTFDNERKMSIGWASWILIRQT